MCDQDQSRREGQVQALKDLARVCFDEGDAGVVVGGIEIVETYVFDTIAALTGDPADQANAEKMRQVIADLHAERVAQHARSAAIFGLYEVADGVKRVGKALDERSFDKAPITVTLRSAVEADVKGRATAEQVRLLTQRSNLIPWLRILSQLKSEAEGHTARESKRLAPLRPEPGTQPSKEYLRLKVEMDQRVANRLLFIESVNSKRNEVALRLSAEALSKQSLGTIIDALVRVEDLLGDGDTDGAHRLLSSLIDVYEMDAEGAISA